MTSLNHTGPDETTEDKETDSKEDSPESHDLVIRDGFPALHLPGGRHRPNIDDPEALPRHLVWACDTALQFDNELHYKSLIEDCETVFSARTRDDQQNYSAGATFFLPMEMKPRCALEALVLSIFQKHTSALDPTTYHPAQSGVEWWTLVLDDENDFHNRNTARNICEAIDTNTYEKNKQEEEKEEEEDSDTVDEVGWHFDADYGLEDQAPNLLLHPRLATVTYLTNHGAPTVVLDVKSPPPQNKTKSSLGGDVCTAWVSTPKKGKHLAFDGRLLHGAPSTYFPSVETTTIEPPTKKSKTSSDLLDKNTSFRKRITLLANIWLNHCPLDAEPLDDELLELLHTPWPEIDTSVELAPFSWNDHDNRAFQLNTPTDFHQISLSTVVCGDPRAGAGTQYVALCGRSIEFIYGAAMEDFHHTSTIAATTDKAIVKLVLGTRILSIFVGPELEEEDSADESEGESVEENENENG